MWRRPSRQAQPRSEGNADRGAGQAAGTELRQLLVEHDQNRTAPKPVSQITVEDLVVKFLERTKAERQSATPNDCAAMLRKLVYGFPWNRVSWKKGQSEPDPRQGLAFTEASAGCGPAT